MIWATEGRVGLEARRAAAFGVVGVEGCVRAVRGGSLEELVLSSCWMLKGKPGMGAGSGVAEGAIELSGVAEGAIELSGVADTYQDELGEFMRNSESFLNGWLKVLLCAGFCC